MTMRSGKKPSVRRAMHAGQVFKENELTAGAMETIHGREFKVGKEFGLSNRISPGVVTGARCTMLSNGRATPPHGDRDGQHRHAQGRRDRQRGQHHTARRRRGRWRDSSRGRPGAAGGMPRPARLPHRRGEGGRAVIASRPGTSSTRSARFTATGAHGEPDPLRSCYEHSLAIAARGKTTARSRSPPSVAVPTVIQWPRLRASRWKRCAVSWRGMSIRGACSSVAATRRCAKPTSAASRRPSGRERPSAPDDPPARFRSRRRHHVSRRTRARVRDDPQRGA